MSKLSGQMHFKQATASLAKLWEGDGDLTKENFKELCWALLNINTALELALNDIHHHVRQQQSAAQSTPTARIYGR